ncbi:hypothetical protein ACFOLD_04290 [Kocuria carniphila]
MRTPRSGTCCGWGALVRSVGPDHESRQGSSRSINNRKPMAVAHKAASN